MYKVISKILSSRLKRVLNKVIDPRQSAFLEGTGLLDSVLVANETLEEVKRKKKECVVFKVDYEKAYDSVSWEFIYYMRGRLGFCDKWIEWIKNCLESSSISVLVNGSPTTEFKPLKGLRQGDPLAPFLFLIAVEGLTGVVRQAEEKLLVESIEVGEKRVKVSMLQYADDTLFFSKASIQSVLNLKAILKCFELASGLKVNYSKSKVGGVGVNSNQMMIFASILNCEIMKSPFSYLGVKVGGNHKRCAFWDGMLIKLRSRLSAWKGKSLSLAGRVCLIKSVLTSLPLFYVSLFCMPTTVVREVKRIQKNFLWDWSSENRKIAWVAWDKICQPKDKCGLGVIDIGKFNLALLGKWIWRLKSEERSLWKDILVSKYGEWRDLRSQGQKSKDSVWRRDLRKVWNLEEWGNDFEDRGQWEVGDGKEIRFWEDKWLDNDTLLHKFPRLFSVSLDTGRNLSQVGVWNNNVWSWKLRWRRILFVWESNLVDILMQLLDNKRLTREGGFKPDKWLWRDGSTDFSVKTAYNILLGEESTVGEELFAEFWNLKTLPSVQFTA